jgi:hypothetical protein
VGRMTRTPTADEVWRPNDSTTTRKGVSPALPRHRNDKLIPVH